jgi:hypothetical protein
MTVPASSITRLQVSVHRQRHAGKGARIGIGIGMIMALRAVADGDCGLAFTEPCSHGRGAELVAVSATAGLVWGSLIGAAVQTERWRDVGLDGVPAPRSARVWLMPARRGAGLAVSVAF